MITYSSNQGFAEYNNVKFTLLYVHSCNINILKFYDLADSYGK